MRALSGPQQPRTSENFKFAGSDRFAGSCFPTGEWWCPGRNRAYDTRLGKCHNRLRPVDSANGADGVVVVRRFLTRDNGDREYRTYAKGVP
jgi:hypothetical protein